MDKINYLIQKYSTGNKVTKPERMAQSAEKFFDRARLSYWKLTDPEKYITMVTRKSIKPLIEATNTVLEDFNVQKALENFWVQYENTMPSLQQRIDAQNRMLGEAIKQKYNKQNTWKKQ